MHSEQFGLDIKDGGPLLDSFFIARPRGIESGPNFVALTFSVGEQI